MRTRLSRAIVDQEKKSRKRQHKYSVRWSWCCDVLYNAFSQWKIYIFWVCLQLKAQHKTIHARGWVFGWMNWKAVMIKNQFGHFPIRFGYLSIFNAWRVNLGIRRLVNNRAIYTCFNTARAIKGFWRDVHNNRARATNYPKHHVQESIHLKWFPTPPPHKTDTHTHFSNALIIWEGERHRISNWVFAIA